MEIRITCQHCGKMNLASIIKYMAWLSELLCISQLITDTERGAGALPYQNIAFAKPSRVLVIDFDISLALLREIKVRRTDMLSQHDMSPLHIFDHSSIEVGIDTAASDGSCEIYLHGYL